MYLTKALSELVEELEKLPGIGPKSAQRLAFFLLKEPEEAVNRLAEVIRTARQKVRICQVCQGFSSEDICEICADERRDRSVLCVVAEPKDVAAIERMKDYHGVYHVLHGTLNPMEGMGPERLKVRELLARLQKNEVKEIILALNPTVEGDATALYLAELLRPLSLKVTRIAHGMPVGGDLDYADQATLHSAFEYRREL